MNVLKANLERQTRPDDYINIEDLRHGTDSQLPNQNERTASVTSFDLPTGYERVEVWRSGCTLRLISEVTLRRARLVLGWANVMVRSQPPRSTQSGHPSWVVQRAPE